jgi:hypothetical protein
MVLLFILLFFKSAKVTHNPIHNNTIIAITIAVITFNPTNHNNHNKQIRGSIAISILISFSFEHDNNNERERERKKCEFQLVMFVCLPPAESGFVLVSTFESEHEQERKREIQNTNI